MARNEESGLFGTGQLGLFSSRSAPSSWSKEREWAAALPPGLHFGTSSWTFEGWADLVYQKQYKNRKTFVRESLSEYARYPLFRTVGIDRSYYNPLASEELERYAAQLTPGFQCVSKVWSELTTRVFPKHHRRSGQVNEKFLDPSLFQTFLRPYEQSFESHCGPFVVQVPPAPGPVNTGGFASVVERLLDAVDGRHHLAFELRDRRLFSQRYLEVLRSHNASHVYNSWSYMPSIGEQRRWTEGLFGENAVIRLMLPQGRTYAEMKKAYQPFDRVVEVQPKIRQEVLAFVKEAHQRGLKLFVIVNNKAEGCSPETIKGLTQLVLSDLR